MSTHMLRLKTEADRELFARAKAKAAKDGLPMRAVLMALLKAYAEERFTVETTAS